ncbi:CbrC family protein [Aquimarina rubra]|uniref:CbrC family protein n=1 Tax=Aquimarina rubra TaxID=1920033 RepID=A0ABW5LAQ0_9FLAO
MGKIFKYIADEALVLSEYSCDICSERLGYNYHAFWVNPETNEEIEISSACKDCIEHSSLEWSCEFDLMDSFGADHKIIEINKHIDWNEGEKKRGFLLRYDKKPIWEGKALELLNKLRKTPKIPWLIQRPDWAVCCEDLCEFQGSPKNYEELIDIQKEGTYWDKGDRSKDHIPYHRDFIEHGEPLLFDEISNFKCLHCNRQYWIDQF